MNSEESPDKQLFNFVFLVASMVLGMAIVIAASLFFMGCAPLGLGQPKGIELGLKIDLAKAPSAKEVKAWRKNQPWRKLKTGWTNKSQATPGTGEKDFPVLINGEPVDKTKFPAVIRLTAEDGAGCTGSLVGPQAILTAAHCSESGKKMTFQTIDGQKYSAVMTRVADWPGRDLDLNVGKVDRVVKGIVPLEIRTDRFEKKDMLVDMIGYGCTNPGGGGGNDGVLRKGSGKITGGQAFDLILDAAPSALCYGDSGGPVLFEGKQIGVNSKGNIEDKSYTTRTTLPEAKAWLEQTAKALGIEIVGISGPVAPPVPPAPGPKQFFFEDANVKIQGIIK